MADESDEAIVPIPATLKEKLAFYTTAFFLLLGIFSAFGFLFLVPFIIEPAYTTIKMDFDEEPAQCITASTESKRGLSNCTWTSCREGCTREVYECTQILVNYKHPNIPNSIVLQTTNVEEEVKNEKNKDGQQGGDRHGRGHVHAALGDGGVTSFGNRFEYVDDRDEDDEDKEELFAFDESETVYSVAGAAAYEETKKYKWFYGARLFPNVKGCGYPPYLNCTTFNNTYVRVGTNFSCYYSRADPSLVVSELDMERVHMNLVCALAIPIVSFIVSVIYLIFAYLYIYNDPKAEKSTPCRRSAATIAAAAAAAAATNKDGNGGRAVQITPLAMSTPLAPPTSGVLTPASDIFRDDFGSFGQQYKYAMVDDMLSRDSLDSLAFSYSTSMNG